jgi:ABC-type lipoprotein release transport system permease subunit
MRCGTTDALLQEVVMSAHPAGGFPLLMSPFSRGPGIPAMAWRNLWRHRRRTLLTLSSIAFGTMLAILFTGIGDAQWREMIDLAARMGGGHVSIQHSEHLDAPTLSNSVADAAAASAIGLRDPIVARAVPRISGQLMLATAGQSYGAAFVAFDPALEDESTFSLLEALDEGQMFETAGDSGIILGAQLSENLGAGIGRKVVYTLTDKAGDIVPGVARVSGIVRTGAPSVDAALTLLPIDTLRKVLGYSEQEATLVALFLHEQRSSEAVAARLNEQLEGELAAVPWNLNQPDLAGFITMKVVSAQFMEVVIMLLVAAGIFNTLFVSVMERLREFGILLAIGFGQARLFALVMWESFWLGVVGLAAGAVVTAGPYYYLSTYGIDITAQLEIQGAEVAGVAMKPMLYSSIYPENLAMIAAFAMLATLAAGIYPAWRAGNVAPVESIRLV